MPLNIRNEAVNQLAGKLAARTRTTKTEAVKIALRNEVARLKRRRPLSRRLDAEKALARSAGPTDTAFDRRAVTDELWDEA